MKKCKTGLLHRTLMVCAALMFALGISAQTMTVNGHIADESGEDLIGASVSVKGTTNGSVTDFDGRFTIENAPSNGTLVISYIGFETQEVAINGQNHFEITLAEERSQLNDFGVKFMLLGPLPADAPLAEQVQVMLPNQGRTIITDQTLYLDLDYEAWENLIAGTHALCPAGSSAAAMKNTDRPTATAMATAIAAKSAARFTSALYFLMR